MSKTIYDALRESHKQQRSLCRSLLRVADAGRRYEIFVALKLELAAHAAAEERYLYAPLLMHDGGLDSSRHALSEHHKVDEIVEEMQGGDPASRQWRESARTLSEKVHHHLKEEETKFFQVSGKLLTETQKRKLASQYAKDYRRMKAMLSQA